MVKTEEEYNIQLAAALSAEISERTGTQTVIEPGHLIPSSGSKRLSWGEVLRRYFEGLSINEGELLPEIPSIIKEAGLSATAFYNILGVPATSLSQPPFSNFTTDVAGGTKAAAQGQTQSQGEAVATASSVLPSGRFLSGPKQTIDTFDDELDDFLDPTSYGPSIDFAAGLMGLLPFGTIGQAMTMDESPLGVMFAKIKEGVTGEPSGYEGYINFDNAQQAHQALREGYATRAQYDAWMNKPGAYYGDGASATGTRWERDFIEGDLELFGDIDLSPSRTIEQIMEANRLQMEGKEAYDEANPLRKWLYPFGEDQYENKSGIPANVIAWVGDLKDGVGKTASGQYWSPRWSYFSHLAFDPNDPRGAAIAEAEMRKDISDLDAQIAGKTSKSAMPPDSKKMTHSAVGFQPPDESIDVRPTFASAQPGRGRTFTGFDPGSFTGGFDPYLDPSWQTEDYSKTFFEQDEATGKYNRAYNPFSDLNRASTQQESWVKEAMGEADFSSGTDAWIEAGWMDRPTVDVQDLYDTFDDDPMVPSSAREEAQAVGRPDYGTSYTPAQQVAEAEAISEAATAADDDWGGWMMQEGGAVPPEGAPPMPMQQPPQQVAPVEGDMANLGMINEQAAPPQEGGQQSVEDDVPREADEGELYSSI